MYLIQKLQTSKSSNVDSDSSDSDAGSTKKSKVKMAERAFVIAAARAARGNDSDSDSGESRREQLLRAAKARNPKDFVHLNNGKGRQFNRYCWECGVNTSHATRGCLAISAI